MEAVLENHSKNHDPATLPHLKVKPSDMELTAKIEPFDSFWEAPRDIEKGYRTFSKFYKHNYLEYVPTNKDASILAISCGTGYFINLLEREGYKNTLGIDSDSDKVEYAKKKGFNCMTARAFPFLEDHSDTFDLIFCEQELNHMTKEEIIVFLQLCKDSLKPNGILLVHTLNGANPITGAEALAQNFDHYNTFTEYSLQQILEYVGFSHIKIFPLFLYVFWSNPLNYILIAMEKLYSLFFTINFMMYGKANRIWTKKIAAVCKKSG